MMAAKLTHIRLLVSDFPASFRFYRDVMGFRATFGEEGESYADFDAGDVALALFDREQWAGAVGDARSAAGPAGDAAALIFAVDDVDPEAERLQGAGVLLVTEPQDRPDWGIRTAHF